MLHTFFTPSRTNYATITSCLVAVTSKCTTLPSTPSRAHILALAFTLLLSASAASVADEPYSPDTAPDRPLPERTNATPSPDGLTIFMIGDSTMANKPLIPANPERGWGQILGMYFKDGARVDNRAVNGRSSKSFRAEGRWRSILQQIKPGDFVVIQFGHNDQKKDSAERYTEPFGSFKQNLIRYATEARERGATPILATPIARRKFDADGNLLDTHGDYVEATRQAAREANVPLLDLNRRSYELMTQLGDESSKRLFDWIPAGEFARHPVALKDDTHFNAYGASRICDLAIEEMKTTLPALARWLKH